MDKPCRQPKRRKMKLSIILALVSITGIAVGLTGIGSPIFSGFCQAFGAVFFILAFITRVSEKVESETH
jgi:hypothetical protein